MQIMLTINMGSIIAFVGALVLRPELELANCTMRYTAPVKQLKNVCTVLRNTGTRNNTGVGWASEELCSGWCRYGYVTRRSWRMELIRLFGWRSFNDLNFQ